MLSLRRFEICLCQTIAVAIWYMTILFGAARTDDSHDFTHSRMLSDAPQLSYALKWTFSGTSPFEDHVIFELHVRSLGWIGLGFSPNGAMTAADIVIGGFNGKTRIGYLWDMHGGEENGYPLMDAQQDYELLTASENATHTILKFRRKLNTCDANDWPITEDTVRVIWAIGINDPENPDSVMKHSSAAHRGTKSIRLLSPAPSLLYEELPPDVETLEFRARSVTIPRDYQTFYWCQLFKLPQRPSKQWLIKYIPVIQNGSKQIVHHMTLFGCSQNMERFVGLGEPCFDKNRNTYSLMKSCNEQYYAGWASGGEAVTYPKEMGISFFDNLDKPSYVLLEIHYTNFDNAQQGIYNQIWNLAIADSSGFRLYFTSTPRAVEIGQLTMGTTVSKLSQIIPPGVASFTTFSYCTKECTQYLSKEGINVIGGLLHTHTAGQKVRVRHYRNGIQLPDILSDEAFDANYQTHRLLLRPVRVEKGDDITVECVYSSFNRTSVTVGGESIQDEMCLVYLEYYPKANSLIACMDSASYEAQISALGATLHQPASHAAEDQSIVSWNKRNLTVKQFLIRYPWTEMTSRQLEFLQAAARDSLHTGFCSYASNDDHAIKESIELLRLSPDQEADMRNRGYFLRLSHTAGHPIVLTKYVSPFDSVCAENSSVSRSDESTLLSDDSRSNVSFTNIINGASLLKNSFNKPINDLNSTQQQRNSGRGSNDSSQSIAGLETSNCNRLTSWPQWILLYLPAVFLLR